MKFRVVTALTLLCLFGGMAEAGAQQTELPAAEITARVKRVRDKLATTHPFRVKQVTDSVLTLRMKGSEDEVRHFEKWRTELEKDLPNLSLGSMHARLSYVYEATAPQVNTKGKDGKDRTVTPPVKTEAPPSAAVCIPAHVAWARPEAYQGHQAIEVDGDVVRWRPMAEGYAGLDVQEVKFVQFGGGQEVSFRQVGGAWEASKSTLSTLGAGDIAIRTAGAKRWRGSEWGKQSNKLVWLPASVHRYVVMVPMRDSYISAEGSAFNIALRDLYANHAAYINSENLCPYNVEKYGLDFSGNGGVTVYHKSGSMFMHVTSTQTAGWPVRRIQ